MRSDRILVVMDGEIIEAGSHKELLRAKGKYHALWSKQVSVKPDGEQSDSGNFSMRNDNLVHDLDSDGCVMPLAASSSVSEDCEQPQDEGGRIPIEGQQLERGLKNNREVGNAPE
jgi:hypothetical protein